MKTEEPSCMSASWFRLDLFQQSPMTSCASALAVLFLNTFEFQLWYEHVQRKKNWVWSFHESCPPSTRHQWQHNIPILTVFFYSSIRTKFQRTAHRRYKRISYCEHIKRRPHTPDDGPSLHQRDHQCCYAQPNITKHLGPLRDTPTHPPTPCHWNMIPMLRKAVWFLLVLCQPSTPCCCSIHREWLRGVRPSHHGNRSITAASHRLCENLISPISANYTPYFGLDLKLCSGRHVPLWTVGRGHEISGSEAHFKIKQSASANPWVSERI